MRLQVGLPIAKQHDHIREGVVRPRRVDESPTDGAIQNPDDGADFDAEFSDERGA